MYSSYQYSTFYTTPHLYSPTVQTYCEQLKNVCHKFVPYLPYAIAPFGLYGICKLFGYLIPGPHRQSRLKLKDKTVLLIGASSGVGRALAFEFYAKGAKVILTARSIDKLEAFCQELVQWGKDRGVENAHQPAFRYLDVSELNGGDDGVAQIRELATYSIDGKTIDVLVNCAGLSSRGSIMETPLAVHRRLMEVNFFGFISITKALMDCIPDDGAILNINSVQGRVAVPFRSPYSCSKHAIQAFFDSLRGEERPQLQILTVNASYIDTGFGSRAINPQGKAMGIEDHNQQAGYSVEYAARQIISALECRKIELVLAPFQIRLVIFLRWIAPNLLWWLLRRKAVADNKRDQKALEEAKKEK